MNIMLLEKLLKEFNFSINTFNLEESKLFDRYFERILISKDTFLIKEGEIERYSYFVYDGMLRCWLLNHKGEEQIFGFVKKVRFQCRTYLLPYKQNLHLMCRQL